MQFVVRFIRPEFPSEIIKFGLAILNDFSKYIDVCLTEFNESLRLLVNELTLKEQPYSREVIHSVCYFDRLTFSVLQPFFFLMNPQYYNK